MVIVLTQADGHNHGVHILQHNTVIDQRSLLSRHQIAGGDGAVKRSGPTGLQVLVCILQSGQGALCTLHHALLCADSGVGSLYRIHFGLGIQGSQLQLLGGQLYIRRTGQVFCNALPINFLYSLGNTLCQHIAHHFQIVLVNQAVADGVTNGLFHRVGDGVAIGNISIQRLADGVRCGLHDLHHGIHIIGHIANIIGNLGQSIGQILERTGGAGLLKLRNILHITTHLNSHLLGGLQFRAVGIVPTGEAVILSRNSLDHHICTLVILTCTGRTGGIITHLHGTVALLAGQHRCLYRIGSGLSGGFFGGSHPCCGNCGRQRGAVLFRCGLLL